MQRLREFGNQLRRQYDPWPFLCEAGTQWVKRLGSSKAQKPLEEVLGQIHSHLGSLKDIGNPELTGRSLRLREQVDAGRPLEEAMPEGFALACEAIWRANGLRPYDCQMVAGMIIFGGAIAEMATGEGKTVAAIFPAYVQALGGAGVHVATVNPYLARRDYDITRSTFEMLGVTTALLPEQASPGIRRRAYGADITYGVGSSFGFDYLRDQIELFRQPPKRLGHQLQATLLGRPPAEKATCQRGLSFAIVDEADSILIDEALTPLIISGATGSLPEEEAAPYKLAREVALSLSDNDVLVDSLHRSVTLSECGAESIYEERLGVPWEKLQRPWTVYVENAFRAEHFFRRDVHYVVAQNKIVLVDEFTGRADVDRTWRDGLHQALEIKEGLPVSAETFSLASISRQRFYRLYAKLGGMTGTAMESAGELLRVYSTPVQSVALHRPSRLEILPDRVFVSAAAKLRAVAEDIGRRHRTGQPVLAGTRTIQASEELAECLDKMGLRYRLLNAKQDREEAEIIAHAGQMDAITLATNMAGRGAHIGLGPGVAEKGGLHVIGLERHESRRVDRQLLGRSGRQGQPGSAQLFVSADDFLLTHYAPEESDYLKDQPADQSGELPAQAADVFERVQAYVEKQLFRQRSLLMEQDHWMEQTKDRMG